MKHTYTKVRLEDYNKFYEKYNHARLDRWHRIVPNISSLPKFLHINEEILEGRETKYELVENDSDYVIKFNSKSNNEYRFDLIREPNTKIYHLGFSESSKNLINDTYENLTQREESIDVFSRLVWILKDINPKIDVDEYCIGSSNNEKKNSIYQYLMKFVSGWEKRNTNLYSLGWAIYFKI